MTRSSRKITATLLAAAGLSSLSPMQQGAALLTAAGAALWASPALASTSIPGVGTVIKKKPGNSSIVAPSDSNGEVRLAGLEPGEYSVRLVEGAEETTMQVGRDGKLAFTAYEDIKRADPRSGDPRARRALPVVRRWAEPLAYRGPCRPPYLCEFLAPASAIDLNSASLDGIAQTTRATPMAARAIFAERQQNGAFKGIEDFAARICSKTEFDFEDASLKIGDQTMLVRRGSDPKNPGFKCKPGDNMFRLYAAWHSYTGHVTLLR